MLETVRKFLVLDVHKQQAKFKAWETKLENKLPSAPPRIVFVANFCIITGLDYLQRHVNRIVWIKGAPDVPTLR